MHRVNFLFQLIRHMAVIGMSCFLALFVNLVFAGSLTLAMELPQLHTEHRNHPTELPSHHTGHQNQPTDHLLHLMAPQSLRMKRLVQIMVHQVQITEHLAPTTEPQPQFTLLHPPSTEARHMELPLPQLSRLPMLGDYHPPT